MSTVWRGFAAALCAAAVAAPVALGLGSPAGASVATSSGGKAKITVGDNYFQPEEIEVTAGTKVVWINKGKILHNVTPNKGKAFGRDLPRGKRYSFKFKKPGTYAYYCAYHGAPGAGQHGTIVVKPAPEPTTTTAVPATP